MESREPESNYEEEPNHDLHDNPSGHNEDDDRSQPLSGDGASPGLVFSRSSFYMDSSYEQDIRQELLLAVKVFDLIRVVFPDEVFRLDFSVC